MLWGKHDGDGKQLAAWQSMVSGFSAACLGPTVTNPFDVIKARPFLLMQRGFSATPSPTAQRVVHWDQIRNARPSPTWGQLGRVKSHPDVPLIPAHDDERHAASLIRYPFTWCPVCVLGQQADVGTIIPAQTRMMAQKKSPEGIQYSGFFDALVKIPRQEGIKAMYKVPLKPTQTLSSTFNFEAYR